MTASCPPGLPLATLDGVLGSYSAATQALTDFWCGVLRRGATPAEISADVLAWLTTTARRDRPDWVSHNRVVAQWPFARLRDFCVPPPAGVGDVIPTLLVPPQAGHASCIVDYAPEQSQVGVILSAGLHRVFVLDWIGATRATADVGIDDYLTAIRDSVRRLGDRVNLIGDCQGGWLAAIYAALYPETVATLTIAGAPIDFHCGEPAIHDWVELLGPGGDLSFYRSVVAANAGVLPGDFLLAGFKALRPESEVARKLQLLANIGDPEYVRRYRTFDTWFEHTQPIPGAFYLWIVQHLFAGNQLVAGTLETGHGRVDLSRIDCPVFLLAGGTDHITPPAQVFALADYAGTPADRVTKLTTTGGHLGLFMGRDALHNYWPPVLRGVAAYSGPADSGPEPPRAVAAGSTG